MLIARFSYPITGMIDNGGNLKNKESKAKNVKKTDRKILFRQKCKGKYIYDKKGAETALNILKKQGNGCLRLYHCDSCDGWHLTHKDKLDI